MACVQLRKLSFPLLPPEVLNYFLLARDEDVVTNLVTTSSSALLLLPSIVVVAVVDVVRLRQSLALK